MSAKNAKNVNRVLTESELDDQIRVGAKKFLAAYVNDAVPRGKKVDDMIQVLQLDQDGKQLRVGFYNVAMRLIALLPNGEREAEILSLRRKMLPAKSDD